MARRLSTGVAGRNVLGSFVAVENNLRSVVNNADVVLQANGTGIARSTTHVQIDDANSLRLADSDSSAYVALRAPNTVASDVVLTLPDNEGTSGQALVTDGSGNLSFANNFLTVTNRTAADNATYYVAMSDQTSGDEDTLSIATGRLEFVPNPGRLSAAELRATASTTSNSTSTGALVVSGGAGVAGALYAGGAVRFTQNTASTSTTTGALVVTGGVGVGGRLTVDNIAAAAAITASNIVANGATSTMRAINPEANNTYDLGTTALRWRNIFTQDLHLSNGIGDYTIVEGEDELFVYNNKRGKVYKFALIEVDPQEATPKISDLTRSSNNVN